MSIGTDAETKKKIIAEYATAEGDTGSPEVQIALLSHRISHLTEHLKTAQARPPQPSWPAAPRGPAPSSAQLPAEDRDRALPLDHRASRPAPLTSWSGCHSGRPLCRICLASDPARVDTTQLNTRNTHQERPATSSARSSVVAFRIAHRSSPAGLDRRPAPSDRSGHPPHRRGPLRGERIAPRTERDTLCQTEGPVISAVETVLDNGKFGTRTVKFETGLLARQAAGSVTAYLDDETMLLSATTAGKHPKDHFDFFPLTIDVEERMYAVGQIPGSFFRSEGRPGEDAILTCRLIDRPLRPTFKKGLRNEVQVVITVHGARPRPRRTTCSRSTPRRCPPSSPACRSPARSVASASR